MHVKMSQKSRFKPSVSWLLLGLLAGLTLGFGIALLVQNRWVSPEPRVVTSESDTLLLATDSDKSANRRRGATSGHTPAEPSDAETADDEDYDADELNDSLYLMQTSYDTLMATLVDEGETIRRDVMIGSRRVKLEEDTGASPQPASSGVDTLITALTAVKIPEGFYREYTLEFWQNPLNYKGYRVVRDKVVLFGLSPEKSYQLFRKNDQLLLKGGGQEYLLRETTSFTPLIPAQR